MKEKLLQLLAENKMGHIFLADLPELMPEIKGDLALYMPIKKGYNPNILWVNRVNDEFIDTFLDLITNNIIDWQPEGFLSVAFEHAHIYTGIPLFEKRMMKTKTKCWCPVRIFLKPVATYTFNPSPTPRAAN